MGKVAYPEMKRFGYDDRLSSASVIVGGTIGILIPPSLGFILYGILTEESVGKLFIAGIFPGILEALFYIITIYILCRLNPKLAPPIGERINFRERVAGLKVVEDVMVFRDQPFSVDDIVKTLGPLNVVKPVAEGSSLGMTLCRSKEDLQRGIELAFQYDQEVMVERHVEGLEVTCCVLGTADCETLPLVEIVPNPEFSFFVYHAKYTQGATREICPARLSAAQTEMAFDCALRAHRALRCRDWSRTDMIVQGETVFLLETNTVPGMTANSLVPLAARTAGMSLSQLVDKLIELSLM